MQNSTQRGDADKEQRDILKKLDELAKRIAGGDTKDIDNGIRDLVKKVQEMAKEGDISHALSDQVIARLTELAAAVR